MARPFSLANFFLKGGIMFSIVEEFLQEFFNYLPTYAFFCILFTLVGGMVFKR